MKKILVSLAFAGLLFTSCTKSNIPGLDDSQFLVSDDDNPHGGGGDNISSTSVPAPVMSAFTSSFQTASKIEWKKNTDGNFKVEFYMNSVKWQVTYAATGAVLKAEHK